MAEHAPTATGRPCRLVGVGHVAIDHLFSVAAAPGLGLKTAAHHYHRGVGGMTCNALVAASRLGAQTRLLAPVGDDDAAAVFARYLTSERVDPSGLLRVPGAHSSVSAIIVDASGERTIINHRGDALARAPDLDLGRLAGADALLTDPRCQRWAEAALRESRRLGLVAVLDADTAPRDDLQRLVGLAAWAVFSTPGMGTWFGSAVADGLAAALAAGADVAVLTQGNKGLLWQRRGQAVQQMPAFAMHPVIDTTGAGDVFHGALALALAEGQADADALRFAAAAAALKCQRPDGVLGAPRRAALDAFLASHR